MEEKDRKILSELQKNCKLNVKQLAKLTGLRPSTVYNRIKRLEGAGVIKNYVAIVDKTKLGQNMTFYIFLKFKPGGPNLSTTGFPRDEHITEFHVLTGEFDILMKGVFKSTEDFGRFMLEFRKKIKDSLMDTKSILVLSTEKETTALPLD
jgi:DNA-binding Lrp family transcriptional regulator|tara:strand:- start:82 stop:531 length:450 start_codon:yes stop_codon:yes gene_type:complete